MFQSFGATAAALSAVVLIMAGCARQAEEPKTASSDSSASEFPEKVPGRATIELSEDIRTACGLGESEAFFDYNSSKLSAAADTTLGKLAECFTTGPMKGRRMALVGHADPRGDEEYNMVLGDRRADSVADALKKRGLAEEQMVTSSRGELEARGEDEKGWAKDRRVNVDIAK